jgi:sporulation protein YlmC with PRC-barrel domain
MHRAWEDGRDRGRAGMRLAPPHNRNDKEFAMAEHANMPEPARTEEWRASQLFHRPVVHALRVEHLGEVADVAFDPESCELAGLLIGPPGPEGNVLDVMRRAVGRDLGLTFVPASQILALDGDVVMVEIGRAHGRGVAGLLGTGRATRWPQLRQMEGFAVVTIQGHRLGRLVDLVLDPSGRHVNGYLINPAAPVQRPSPPAARPFFGAKRSAAPAGQTDTRAATSAKPAQPSSTSLLVVPASAHVRVGRDLLAVGLPTGSHWNGQAMPAMQTADGRPPTWPAQPGRSLTGSEDPAGHEWRRSADLRYPPDTPTEAL